MVLVAALRTAQLRPLGLSCRRFATTVPVLVSRLPQASTRRTCVRFATSSAKPAPAPGAAPPLYMLPARLCVYHAGTPRVTFLACLKLSTIFIFAFFGFVVTPAFYEQEGLGATTMRTAIAAMGPLLVVGYLTAPFVPFVHMRLPPFARQSEANLRAFVRKLPAQTELEITTMSLIAKPRVSKVMVSDMRPANRRFGIVNYVRDTTTENAVRPWYMFRAVGEFNMQHNRSPRVRGVWEEIAASIARQGV